MKNFKAMIKKAQETTTQAQETTTQAQEQKIVLNVNALPVKSAKTEQIILDCIQADTANGYKTKYLNEYLTRYFLIKFIELGENYSEPVILTGLQSASTISKVLAQLPFIYYIIGFEAQFLKDANDYKKIECLEIQAYIKTLTDRQKQNLSELYNIEFVEDDGQERRNLELKQEAAEEINSLQRSAGLTETVQF